MTSDVREFLRAEDVSVAFGGIRALDGVDFGVAPANIVGLLGPNGAGKSTLLGVLSGLIPPSSGHVLLRGEDITVVPPHKRARLGIARTFQHPEVFTSLTVREHMIVAYRARFARRRFWADLVGGTARRPTKAESTHVEEVLALMRLEDLQARRVDELPLGLLRLVELGRAITTDPCVILMDEPTSGLHLEEREYMGEVLRSLVQQKQVSLVLVEHDAEMVLGLADVSYVLDFGVCIASGTSDVIRNSSAVQAAYLGDLSALEGKPA